MSAEENTSKSTQQSEMKSIEEYWESFRDRVILPKISDPLLLEFARDVFYAGVIACSNLNCRIVLNFMAGGDLNEVAAQGAKLNKDIEKFEIEVAMRAIGGTMQ